MKKSYVLITAMLGVAFWGLQPGAGRSGAVDWVSSWRGGSTLLAAEPQSDASEWSVESAPGDYTDFSLDATEGTWISLDVSPDGESIVFDLLGHLYSMPIVGGRAEPLSQGMSWDMFPRFSPEGDRIAFTSDRDGSNDIWVMQLSDGSVANVSQMELPVFQSTWSSDGRHLYATALDMRVRFPAYRFNLHGTRQEILPAGERTPVNHFQERDKKLYYVHNDRDLYASGPRIKTYDLSTGELSVYLDRPGGAAAARISPDGHYLAYVNRDDQETTLVLHDLRTRAERVLVRGLDRGRVESGSFYGAYSNLAWHSSAERLFVSFGGGIHSVDVATGRTKRIEFTAPVRRRVAKTHRVQVDVPVERARSRSHRWGVPTSQGILFEALGDLHIRQEGQTRVFVDSEAHETNPIVDEQTGFVYYAKWTDEELGAIARKPLAGGPEEVLTRRPSQYGALSLSADGKKIAFLRGGGTLMNGEKLEEQIHFELGLIHLGEDRPKEQVVTSVDWSANRYAKRPPTIDFSSDGEWLLFTEFEEDRLTLKQIRLNGESERALYRFLHATRARVSPDFRWVVYREYHRSFVTPFEYAGQLVEISAADSRGFNQRVDPLDGDFTEWVVEPEGLSLHWTRGTHFYTKSLEDVLAGQPTSESVDLSFEFEIGRPASTIALTGVRILTMNSELDVLEGATILVEGDRITAVGSDVAVPANAKVYELAGRTVMPGIFDAHGHFGSPISPLNVIERNLYGLRANLAYGVTTMYDVYGTTQKDFWVSDMLRRGSIEGPRVFSVGDPMFVTKYRTKMHRPIQSLDDAMEHVRFNKDHGATSVKDYSNHRRAARQQLIEASRSHGVNLVTESFADPQMNLTQLIDGFTGIEHSLGLTPVYEDVLALFAHTEIGMTPTLIVVYNGPSGERYFHQRERLWEDEKLLNFFRRDELVRYRRTPHFFDDDFYHKEMAESVREFHKRGVLLQMGAHGQMMGLGAHWEIEMFVHGGFEPLEALQIATINGYRHHGLDHVLGSVEVGKLADPVVLNANPLEDIRHTREIAYVLKNGVVYSGTRGARLYPRPAPAPELYFQIAR